MSSIVHLSLVNALKYVQMGLRNGNVVAAEALLNDLVVQAEAYEARLAAAAAVMPTCHPGYVDPAGS